MAEEEFFNVLQKHSEAKLTILRNYVIPWMRKIVLDPWNLERKCLIIDGFAGKGKYEAKAGEELPEGVSSEVNGSPIILLEAAIDFCKQAGALKKEPPNIILLFVEGDDGNFNQLQQNLTEACGIKFEHKDRFHAVPDYPTIKIMCVNGQFKDELSRILNSVSKGLVPSFSFIDPFGFSHTPLDIIKRLMANKKAEFLINFIYEETNRFIMHENAKIQEHISNHFGVQDLEEIKTLIGDSQKSKRKEIIVNYYTRQLKEEANVQHVRNFVIKKNGRNKLILFSGTNHYEGLKLMKKVMWNLDGTGSYTFDDRKSLEDIQLSFRNELRHEEALKDLAVKIHEIFTGKENITESEVESFVILHTDYPAENFIKPALCLLEDEGKLLSIAKMDGSRRKKHSFNKVLIKFS